MVTDAPRANSATRQNLPVFNPPLYIAVTTELIMEFQYAFGLRISKNINEYMPTVQLYILHIAMFQSKLQH